jgi:Flp pilus assembly secretin CpaC
MNSHHAQHRSSTGSLTKHARRAASAAAALAAVCLVASATLPWASGEECFVNPEPLIMVKGQTTLLCHPGMRRVAIGEVEVADVAVVSSRELIVYARNPGDTDLYIWDNLGVHRRTVTVTTRKPADVAQVALAKLLGDEYRVTPVTDTVLVVEGTAQDQAELDRIAELMGAVDDGVKVVNLVSLRPAPAPKPPVEQIAAALGPGFKVGVVGDRAVVVEGTPATPEEAQRAKALLAVFEGQAQIVDLIREPAPEVPSLDKERELLASALGDNVSVRAIGGTALLVEGTLPADADAQRVAHVIETLELRSAVLNETQVAAPDEEQILVRAKVVEVRQEDLERIGVNWGHLGGEEGGFFQFVDQPFLFGEFPGEDFTWAALAAQLDLLAQKNRANILAQPNILVNDGEEASILVGGEVPIPVPQVGAGAGAVITIEYKEFGVQLMVQPTIVDIEQGRRKINLKLTPEVSSIDAASSITISGISVPGFRTRRTETIVNIDPGATLVIGGLIQRDVAEIRRKIPLLGDIPIIGQLFRSKQFVEGKTDLMIMVTPEIRVPE